MPQPAPKQRDCVIRFEVPEFTCLCPLTGQPDFARVEVEPRILRLHADWYVRGGIRTYVTAEHRRKGGKPLPRVDLGSMP